MIISRKVRAESKTGELSSKPARKASGGCAKFTISLPLDDFARIEQLRKELSITRSQFVLLAARRWFEEIQRQKSIADYLRGYEQKPEEATVAKAMEQAQSVTACKEAW